MPVPSDAVIASARGDEIQQLLDAQLAEGTGAGAADVVDALEEEHDLRSIAAAALTLLAAEHGLDLEGDFDERPPRWAQARVPPERGDRRGARGGRTERGGRERGGRGDDRGPRPARGEAAAVELFLPVGRRRGVRPADLVGALANDAGIDGRSIGRITILDAKSFVRVSEASASLILARGDVEVRGTRVPVKRAHPRTEGPPGRSDGPPGRGDGPRHKKGRGRPPRGPRRNDRPSRADDGKH